MGKEDGHVQTQKKSIEICDESMHSIKLCLWGEEAVKKLQLVNVGEIVAFKNCRVSDFDTWSLVGSSDVGDTTIDVRHGRNVELKSFYSKH